MEAYPRKALVRFYDTFLSQIIDRYESLNEEEPVFDAYAAKLPQLKQESNLLLGVLDEFEEETGFDKDPSGSALREVYSLVSAIDSYLEEQLAEEDAEEEDPFEGSVTQELFEADVKRVDELVGGLINGA